MTACIVGWAHSKFGKLDGETSESLVVKVAGEAMAHAGIEPRDVDVIYVGNMNGGFVKQEFHSSLPLQTHPDLRFKPSTRVENACATGSAAIHMGINSLAAKKARFVLVVGVEKMTDTLRLCRLNLAVHGLSGDIREANTYYDDPHKLAGRFDYVLANPPFNQPEVDRAKLVTAAGKVDARFPFGLPTVNNANYLWISLFFAALKPTGRAGFVMANSASDAGGSEKELRRKLIETGAVDCIVAVGPNMFFTVTLPVTLWFLDRSKSKGPRGDQVLFVDLGPSAGRGGRGPRPPPPSTRRRRWNSSM